MNKDKGLNTRSTLVLIFEIFLVVVAVGGLTFATSTMFGSSTIIKMGEYNVDYLGDTEIVVGDLEPISDSLINYNTTSNVMRLEFSLRGVDTNENPERLIYDVMVTDLNIDCSLLNKYTKWNLYKNGELLYSGNFDPAFDGNVLTDNFRLTETQQKLPLSTDNYDNYVLLIWISEACEDVTSCELVDQSGVINSDINMKVFIALSGGESVLYERVPNMNPTCVNKPVLYNGMIPVYYDNGNWRIADKTNSSEINLWYDYGNEQWANVVMVNTDKYKESSASTVIDLEDVLGFYVWVPRFKYKLWNDDKNTDSYNAYKNGIDVVFESGVNSSGKIVCTLENCTARANKYLTHPAFSNNLRGFWISKYEVSDGVKFVPNVLSTTNRTLDEYKTMMNGLSTTYNLMDTVDSHMVTNLEWGATLYLSHSKYGLCNDDGCENLDNVNNYMVYGMNDSVSEYTIGSRILGSALSETENWYSYIKNTDNIVRGNDGDITTRVVLVNK